MTPFHINLDSEVVIPSTLGPLINFDLQEYVKDDKIKLRVETVTDETIPQNVTIDVFSKFL